MGKREKSEIEKNQIVPDRWYTALCAGPICMIAPKEKITHTHTHQAYSCLNTAIVPKPCMKSVLTTFVKNASVGRQIAYAFSFGLVPVFFLTNPKRERFFPFFFFFVFHHHDIHLRHLECLKELSPINCRVLMIQEIHSNSSLV